MTTQAQESGLNEQISLDKIMVLDLLHQLFDTNQWLSFAASYFVGMCGDGANDCGVCNTVYL